MLHLNLNLNESGPEGPIFMAPLHNGSKSLISSLVPSELGPDQAGYSAPLPLFQSPVCVGKERMLGSEVTLFL